MDEPKINVWDARTRESFEAIQEMGEGKPAIFMEYPTVHYVRVHGVTTSDWGVDLEITCIPAEGFELLGREKKASCPLSCAWKLWCADAEEWRAQQISWQLYFDPELVEALVAEAANLRAEGKSLDYGGVMGHPAFHQYRMRGSELESFEG